MGITFTVWCIESQDQNISKSLHLLVVTSLDHIGSVCTCSYMFIHFQHAVAHLRRHLCQRLHTTLSSRGLHRKQEGARQHASTNIITLQKRWCIQRIKEKTNMFWLSCARLDVRCFGESLWVFRSLQYKLWPGCCCRDRRWESSSPRMRNGPKANGRAATVEMPKPKSQHKRHGVLYTYPG